MMQNLVKHFGKLMFLGLSYALYLAVSPLIVDAPPRPDWLLWGSLIHMMILMIVAWANKGADVSDSVLGARVATTGYLHTLIGICAALAGISVMEDPSPGHLAEVIKPIGAALSTSIIGWWAGSELGIRDDKHGYGEAAGPHIELQRLEKSLKVLNTSIMSTAEGLSHAGGKLGKNIDELPKMISEVAEKLTIIKVHMEKISGSTQKTSAAMQEAAVSSVEMKAHAETTGAALARASGLIDQVDTFLAKIRKERDVGGGGH